MKLLKCQNCNGDLDLSKGTLGNVLTCEYCESEHVLENRIRFHISSFDPNPFRIFLREMIVKYFNMQDLRLVYDNLEAKTRQFNFEDIRGETKSAKALEMVLYGQRRGLLELMIEEMMIYSRPFALAIDTYVA